MLVIISANLHNFKGESGATKPSEETKAATKGKISQFLSDLADEANATLICTQEDDTGVPIAGFEMLGEAGSGFEVVRVYGRENMNFEVDKKLLVKGGKKIAERHALVVTTPGGLKVANVFMSGGKYEDKNFELAPEARQQAAEKLLGLDVLVGDWNADIDIDNETKAFTETSRYVSELKFDSFKLQRWLKWRRSPFAVLLGNGFEALWPAERTVPFNLAVDGAWYRPSKLHGSSVRVKQAMLDMSDHAAVVFQFLPSLESFFRCVHPSIADAEPPDDVLDLYKSEIGKAGLMRPEGAPLFPYLAEALERDIVIDDGKMHAYPCCLYRSKEAVMLLERAGSYTLQPSKRLEVLEYDKPVKKEFIETTLAVLTATQTSTSWSDAIGEVKQHALDLVAMLPYETSLFNFFRMDTDPELDDSPEFRFEVSQSIERQITVIIDDKVYISRPTRVQYDPLVFVKTDEGYKQYGQFVSSPATDVFDDLESARVVLQVVPAASRLRARFLGLAMATHKAADLPVRLSKKNKVLDDAKSMLSLFLAAFAVAEGNVDKINAIPTLSVDSLLSMLRKRKKPRGIRLVTD